MNPHAIHCMHVSPVHVHGCMECLTEYVNDYIITIPYSIYDLLLVMS